MLHYVAIADDGEVLGIERTATAAADIAMDARPDNIVQVEEIDETRSNPEEFAGRSMPGSRFAELSFQATGIGLIPPSVAEMKLEDAKETLKPYFNWLRARKSGSPVKVYNTVSGMTKAWIGQNYKTSKTAPEARLAEPTKVMGLTLTPHELVYQLAHMPGKYTERFTDKLKALLPARPAGFTFCKGASEQCKQSCLMYAGQNAAAVYNTHRKAIQSVCLMREPKAFMRVLIAAIQQHECIAPTEGFKPMIRLNVLSDIPWERHAEWLFEMFPRMQFYDYTKVEGRVTPPNYELTFSFSGSNLDGCKREIADHGRKVAVVFIAHKPKNKSSWQAWKKTRSKSTPIPLPDRFWELPVIDGDVSDVRPFDRLTLAERFGMRDYRGPAIVGLRWKSPSFKKSGLKVDPIKQLDEELKAGVGAKDRKVTFVIPTYVVDGKATLFEEGGFPLRSNPWTRPNPNEEQFLITAATPRFEAIEQDVALPE